MNRTQGVIGMTDRLEEADTMEAEKSLSLLNTWTNQKPDSSSILNLEDEL